ncbi:MAG: LysR substrate-binding domain-containing protein, partial [Bacteriovoracaceae bacterium]
EIDVAILATNEDKSIYSQECIFNEELFLYLNKEHSLMNKRKIKISDIKTEEIWLLDEGHCLRDEVIEICKLRSDINRRPAKISFKVGSLESLKHIVNEQGGYTLLPQMAIERLSKQDKKLIKSLSPSPKRSIYLTKRRRFLKKALIDAFKNEILDII